MSPINWLPVGSPSSRELRDSQDRGQAEGRWQPDVWGQPRRNQFRQHELPASLKGDAMQAQHFRRSRPEELMNSERRELSLHEIVQDYFPNKSFDAPRS